MPNILRNLGVGQSQWTQPYSYVRRSLGANVVKSTVCNRTIDEFRARVRKRAERIERWQSRVTWSCIVLATLVACYFAAQLGRGVL